MTADPFKAAPAEWEAVLASSTKAPNGLPSMEAVTAFGLATGSGAWGGLKLTILGLVIAAAEVYFDAGVDMSDGSGYEGLTDTPGAETVRRVTDALAAAVAGGPKTGPAACLAVLTEAVNTPTEVVVAFQTAAALYHAAVDDPHATVPVALRVVVPEFEA